MGFDKLGWNRKWRRNHKEHIREYNLRYYDAHHVLARGRNMHDSHWLKRLKESEKTYLNRLKVLSYYSNPQGIPICNRCGEQDLDVLCIDHINGGGNRSKGEIRRKGTGLYSWLVVHNYPEGLQVLCANCNQRKAKLEQVLTRSLGKQELANKS